MQQDLRVIFAKTFDNKPLLTLCNLPGQDADMTPAYARALAAAISTAADDCERAKVEPNRLTNIQRSYSLTPNPDSPLAVGAELLSCASSRHEPSQSSVSNRPEGQRPTPLALMRPYLRRYPEDEIRKLKAELGSSPNPASPAPTACVPAPQTLPVAPVGDLTGHE